MSFILCTSHVSISLQPTTSPMHKMGAQHMKHITCTSTYVHLLLFTCGCRFSLPTELGLLLTMFTAYLIKLMTVLLCLQLNCCTKPQAAPPSLRHGSTSSSPHHIRRAIFVPMIHICWHRVVVNSEFCKPSWLPSYYFSLLNLINL